MHAARQRRCERIQRGHLRRGFPGECDRPRGVLVGRREAASTGRYHRPRRSIRRTRRSTGGFPTANSTSPTTPWTGTSTAGRGDQAALIYDSPVTGHAADLHLPRTARRGRRLRRGAGRTRGGQGRSGGHLHADDPAGRDRDAGLRPARRRALGGLRRVRPEGAGDPDRRRQAQGDRVGVLRHRGQEGHPVRTVAERGDRAGRAQAGEARHPAAPAADRRARPRTTSTGPRRWRRRRRQTRCR